MKDPFGPHGLYSSFSGFEEVRKMLQVDAGIERALRQSSDIQDYLSAIDPVGAAIAASGALGSAAFANPLEHYMKAVGSPTPIRNALLDAAADTRRQLMEAVGPLADLKHLTAFESASMTLASDMAVRAVFPDAIADMVDWEKRFGHAATGLPFDALSSGALGINCLGAIQGLIDDTIYAGPFSASALANIGTSALEQYENQLRSILGDIDWDEWTERARDLGESIASDMSDDEEEDVAPTVDRLRSSINTADVQQFFVALQAVVQTAVQNELADKKHQPTLLHRFLSAHLLRIVVGILMVIGGPLFERWLDQRDAEQAAELKREQVRTAREARSAQRLSASGWVVVISNGLNLRVGPSTKQLVVAVAQQGHTLRVLKRKHTWALVRYVDPEGEIHKGWVNIKYIRAMEQEALALIMADMVKPSASSSRDSSGESENSPDD